MASYASLLHSLCQVEGLGFRGSPGVPKWTPLCQMPSTLHLHSPSGMNLTLDSHNGRHCMSAEMFAVWVVVTTECARSSRPGSQVR